jgi:cobyrinic acid a,c-diamide synthase
MNAQPRLVVSAPSSGHGKTAIAVGLLAAAAARGVAAAGFKVGPDHTDAAYLGLAAGRPGRNLDPRLVGGHRVAPLFAHGASGSQLAVIEGAMGLFDSLTGQPEIDGTAAVAAALRAPVVLVVDVAAMGHSIAALVHGFRMFDEMVHLGGVILNRIASPRHEQMLRTALDDIGMPVLGALRRGDLPNVLPARAHGPVPVAHRTVEAGRAVRRLGEAVLAGLDLDRLIALAHSAPALPGPLWTPAEAIGAEPFEHRPVIALAGGPGAPYTYVETAELLTAAGADVAVVDPLRDETLPAGTRALVVGAGLPEGYAEELSANRRLCDTVAKFAADGWPVVAEGVGLPWLGHEFDGRPMCGVLDATAYTGEQTVAGYREATAPTTSVPAPAGARITGYKQHRAVVTPRSGAVPAWTWSGGNPEGFVWRQVHASQLGLHWAAAPEIAKRLVAAAIAGPPSLQPKATPEPATVPIAMSSPLPDMPTAGIAPSADMPSQISGPDFGPPADRGAEFGPGFGRPEYTSGADGRPQVPGLPSRDPGSPASGLGQRGPVEPAQPGAGLGERVAAQYGAVYGAHSNGVAVDQPFGERMPSGQGFDERPADLRQGVAERPADLRQGVAERPGMSDQVAAEWPGMSDRVPAEWPRMSDQAPPERAGGAAEGGRPGADGSTSGDLSDTVDIAAP